MFHLVMLWKTSGAKTPNRVFKGTALHYTAVSGFSIRQKAGHHIREESSSLELYESPKNKSLREMSSDGQHCQVSKMASWEEH